jgi:hypothetical protein
LGAAIANFTSGTLRLVVPYVPQMKPPSTISYQPGAQPFFDTVSAFTGSRPPLRTQPSLVLRSIDGSAYTPAAGEVTTNHGPV